MKSNSSSRILRLSSIVLAISVLSACAVVTGKYEPIAQVNNDVLNLPDTSGQTLAQWPHEGWWRAYNDATLNNLIEQALADGPSLKVLAQRAKTAQSKAPIAVPTVLTAFCFILFLRYSFFVNFANKKTGRSKHLKSENCNRSAMH